MVKRRAGLNIYFAIIAIFVIFMGAIIYIVHFEINTIVTELIQREAQSTNRAFANTIKDLEKTALERAVILSGNEHMRSDLISGDREAIKKTLTGLSEGLDFATICGPDGVVIARTNSEKYGDDILWNKAVSSALSTGVTSSSIEDVADVGLSIYVSTPIFDGNSIMGVVSCCYDLTKPELVDDFKAKNGCEAAIFYGDGRVSTTFMDEVGNRKIGTTVDQIVVDTVIGNKSAYTGRLNLFGKAYETCLSPLTVDDMVIGMLSTAIAIDSTLARQSTINYWIVLIAGIGIAAAITVTALTRKFSKTFSNTLGKLSSKEGALNTLTKILSGMESLLYVSDLETDEIVFINDKMRAYFNLGDDTVGKPCWSVLPLGRQSRCVDCPKRRLISDPETPIVWDDYSAITKKYFRRNDSVIDWPGGKKVHLGEAYDITDLEGLQNELMRMSSIIFSSPNFVSYKNISGECLYINSAATVMTGYSEEELMNDYLGLLFDENSAEFIKTVAPLVLLEEGELNYEAVGKRKDGKEIVLSISSFMVSYDERAFGTVATDITEKKQIEAEKDEAMAKAERASLAKSEFLSRMSHEMRTPMNAILGMTNIAKGTKDLAKRDYCLNKVDCAAKHLMSMISDILDMTNFESGQLELKNSAFSYKKMIMDTIGIIDFGSDEKLKRFAVNLDENIPSVIFGDERRLGQVVANLLSNAVKFTGEDGRITLNARVTEFLSGRYTILTEVIDNGVGIPKDSQALLFQAFEQVDGGISRMYGGTGLGLAISKHIIDLMNGSIWVESEPGKGSKFSFKFTVGKEDTGPDGGHPICKRDSDIESMGICSVSASDADAGMPEPGNSGSDYAHTILIVEDDEINRLIIQEIIHDNKLDSECAENGCQALEVYCAQPEKYALILMDINMPVMDGRTATKCIRALDDHDAASIPIIALTANVFQEDIDRCFEVGMNEHVGKPINVADLLNKMRKHIKL